MTAPDSQPAATVSVIVPTKGRQSLTRTLASIVPQLAPGDEIIVVRDAWGDKGNTARMDAMARARGTHLAFMDDDDVYAPDAFETMRRFARTHPGRIGIFKMEHVVGTTHWRAGEPELRFANVSSQNLLVPNRPGKLGRWREVPRPEDPAKTYAGDYTFITETIELQEEPIFVDEVTVFVRPVGNPLRRLWIRARYRAALRTRARRLAARLRRS